MKKYQTPEIYAFDMNMKDIITLSVLSDNAEQEASVPFDDFFNNQ